ncbi:MAG TPA: family 1 glycosylhydrolase, partial [Tepidiformaceae bacterium]|nr:family 1 glycosylhydrolase [Tepidiformaceae bacterium]
PDGLRRLLVRLHEDYPGIPVHLTETGAAYPDAPDADGEVRDPARIDFLDSYLRAVHAAIQEGADVRGFFQWSLMDNFEWAFGFSKRFGMVYTDFATQARIPKRSAAFYSDVIARNGVDA